MARTAVRVSALIFRDDKILLFHRFRDGSEYWVIPGGGVEEGETLEEALQRELWEETSLQLISCRHAFDFSHVLREEDRISHFYICQTQGEPMLGDGPEKLSNSEYPSAAGEIKKFLS